MRAVYGIHPQAHFVPIRKDRKTPLIRGWPRRRLGIDTMADIMRKGHGVGIVPNSIGTAVIDVDAGDPNILAQARPPLAMLMTPRGGHGYYPLGDNPPRNMAATIDIGDVTLTADVIVGAPGAKYCVFHGSGLPTLADSLLQGEPPVDFPIDLIQARDIPIVAGDDTTSTPTTARYVGGIDVHGRIVLARIPKGMRNECLKTVCCGKGERGQQLWDAGEIESVEHFVQIVLEWNREFPQPLPTDEAIRVARSTFRYLHRDAGGKGANYYTHDSESQRRRQLLSVKARLANRARFNTRQEEAQAMRDAGMYVNAIAKRFGVNRRTIHRWLNQPA